MGNMVDYAFDGIADKETPLSCMDMILPPPPEFQEDEEDHEIDRNSINTTIRNADDEDGTANCTLANIRNLSATPDFLSPPHKNSQLAILGNRISTSTPISGILGSQQSLNVSPIGLERQRNLNVLEIAKSSKFSPLTIVAKPLPVIERKPALNLSKQQSILNYVMPTSQEANNRPSTPVNKKPCIACSRLSKDQVIAISSLTNKKLATYSNTFGTNVTHVVVAVNEKNCVKDHTIKFVCAVAAGIWVVSFRWIQECLVQNRLVAEVCVYIEYLKAETYR